VEKENSRNNSVLGLLMILVVAGSHFGMLWLCVLYGQVGRLANTISPEPILGGVSIIFFVFFKLQRSKDIKSTRVLSFPLICLGCFCFSSIAGEILRGNSFDHSTISSFFVIFINSLMGAYLGANIAESYVRIPFLKTLLAIYLIWYVGMAFFYTTGELGFYGILPGTDRARLQFLSGFTSTEIPIYVGFHFPVLLYILLQSKRLRNKILVLAVIASSLVLSAMTASSAVIAALLIVLIVFLSTLYNMNFSKMAPLYTIALASIALVFVGTDIGSSSILKISDFQSGEGERSAIYQSLLDSVLRNPWGIGRGQFAATNESFDGSGLYPHHNLLGIGAELGAIPLFFYILFILSSTIVCIKHAFKQHHNLFLLNRRLIIATGLSIFLYQMFRGFFHDTWTFKETYFWIGVSLGASVMRDTDVNSS
jgi:hypothetical protein